MSQSRASLSGVTLRGGNAYDWELRAGVMPVERLWPITAKHAEAFRGLLGLPQELVIQGPRKTLRVRHVYPIEILPGSNPNMKVLRVADRRWKWSRRWVAGSFNMRFATGTAFLMNDAGQIENAVLQPEQRYRKATLYPPDNPAEPWTPQRVIEYVFNQIHQPLSYKDSASLLINVETYEVQDLILDDAGDDALDRVLAYFAGVEVYVDLEGNAVLYDSLKESGGAVLPRLARKQVTGADVELTTRTAIAPSKVIVLYTTEVEIRFNATEGGDRVRDTAQLFPVAPSPDAAIILTTGKKVARNSLVPQETLFLTWGPFGFLQAVLSFAVIAKLGYASSVLEQIYGNNTQAVFDPVAAARIRVAVQHWRRLYQIDEQFMGRLESVRAVRATILNTETGARAPSAAYCDYTRRPAARGFLQSINAPNKQMGWAVRGYADLLADGRVAPARVTVQDPTLGVLSVEPQLDPWGFADAIMLGFPEKGFVPTITGGSDANRTGDDAYAQWLAGPMDTKFQLATVLTAVPSSPNNIHRFHAVEIQSSHLGLVGSGPPLYVRVWPGVMSARFAWSDALETQITGAIKGTGKLPLSLLVNAQDVQNVAAATARRALEPFMPRLTGSVDVDLDPELVPIGPISSVRHALDGGVTSSRATAAAVRQARELWPYLEAGTRRAILHVLNSGELS